MSTLLSQMIVPLGVAAGVIVLGLLRRYIPALRLIGSPLELAAARRADRAEAELAAANTTIRVQEAQLAALAKERSLKEVVDLIGPLAQGMDQTLEKLGSLNGGLEASAEAHREAAAALAQTNMALQASTKAIEFIAGQVLNKD